MPGAAHPIVSHQAYKMLDSWERELWYGKDDVISYFSLLPDNLFVPEYKEYCILPDGNTVPHGPTDKQWTMLPFVSGYDRSVTRYVLSYYIGKLVDSISSKDIKDSIAFGGVLSHYIADGCHPAHLWNNLLIYDLLPPPEGRYWQLHRSLDNLPIHSDVYKGIAPRMLGLDVEETVFHAIDEYEKMVQWGKTKLVPTVNALYSGDAKTAEAHVNTCYKRSVSLLSSIWHTAFCIASNRFEETDVESLKKVRLNRIVPVTAFTVDPYFFYPLMDHDCDGEGNLIPLSLKVSEQGGMETREFSDGIAMTFGYVMYEIPPGLFRRIRVKAGISPLVERESEAVFRIIDAKNPPAYKDAHNVILDYGGKVLYESRIITEKDACENIEVNPGRAGLITLFVECPGKNKNVHGIWADPVLIK